MEENAQPVTGVSGSIDAAAGGATSGKGVTDDPRLQPPTPRVTLMLIAAGIIGVLLYLGRDALTPFVIGLILVYLLDPPVERLSRGPIPRWLAILIVYAVAIALFVGAISLTLQPLVRQLNDFIRHLPELFKSFDALLERLQQIYEDLGLPQQIRDLIDRLVAEFGQGAGGFDPSILLPVFTSVAGFLVSLFAFLVIPVWVFYLLKDRPWLTARFDTALPAEWRADAWAIVDIVDDVFGRWVRGQLVLGLVVGAATFIGLMVLSVVVDPVFGRFAVFFAILAGILELLPIIGPIISAIPPLLVALTVSPVAIVAVLVLYFAIQQVENSVLVPKIQGDAIQLHPSAVVFALILGAAIAGFLGAILALPITAAGRDVYRYLFRRLSRNAAGTAPAAGAGRTPAMPPDVAASSDARRPVGTPPGPGDG